MSLTVLVSSFDNLTQARVMWENETSVRKKSLYQVAQKQVSGASDIGGPKLLGKFPLWTGEPG